MSDVIDFQKEAIGRLRARVAELDGANDSLLAVTRGHRGAAAMVHRAVLAALDADGLDHLVHVIIADWVDILGLDVIVLALESGSQHIRMGTGGIRFLAPQDLDLLFPHGVGVVHGHSLDLFGEAQPLLQSYVAIRLPALPPLPTGVLALGSRAPAAFEAGFETELFDFLGACVARCVARWLTTTP